MVGDTVLILAVETATTAVAVALHDGVSVIAELTVAQGRRHAETLVPAIGFLCAQVQGSVNDVTAVAVDVGPGLFTGLRVGVTTAKTLAMALGVPLFGETSLSLLARQGGRPGERVAAVIDARRKELYAAVYDLLPDGDVVEVLAPMVAPAEVVRRVLDQWCAPDTIVVGDAHDQLKASADTLWRHLGPHFPSAATLSAAVVPRLRAGENPQTNDLELVYLRAPDAQITWSNRHGLAT